MTTAAPPPRTPRPDVYIIVVGGGIVGYGLALELQALPDHEVTIVERSESRARELRDELGEMIALGDGCEISFLESVGARRCDLLIAVTADDGANLVACQVAKHWFDVDRTIVATFAVGGALAGVAATLWALLFRGVSFITGFLPGIKAFTAAVLGGIGNLGGAMAGGVFLGLFEGVGPQLVLGGFGIPAVSRLKDVVAFTALVLVLIFKPTGLFGERLATEDRA